MPTAAVTWGSRIEVGTLPVCPPPSPPWATTAPAPSAATFSACRLAPTDGMTTRPASVSWRITFWLGASPNEATRTPCLISSAARSGRSGASPRRFTPNGAAVSSLVRAIAASVSATVRVAPARTPSPPALAVAAVSSGVDTQPMPVCTIGYRIPSRSQAAVRSAGWKGAGWLTRISRPLRGGTGPRPSGPWRMSRHLPVTQPARVDDLADEAQLRRRRHPGRRHVVVDRQAEAGTGDDLGHADAGMHGNEPHGVAGGAEVEHRQVRDDPPDLVEPA